MTGDDVVAAIQRLPLQRGDLLVCTVDRPLDFEQFGAWLQWLTERVQPAGVKVVIVDRDHHLQVLGEAFREARDQLATHPEDLVAAEAIIDGLEQRLREGLGDP